MSRRYISSWLAESTACGSAGCQHAGFLQYFVRFCYRNKARQLYRWRQREHLQRVRASQGSRQMVQISVRRAVRMMTVVPRREYKPQNSHNFDHKSSKSQFSIETFHLEKKTGKSKIKVIKLIRTSIKYFILKKKKKYIFKCYIPSRLMNIGLNLFSE